MRSIVMIGVSHWIVSDVCSLEVVILSGIQDQHQKSFDHIFRIWFLSRLLAVGLIYGIRFIKDQ